MHTSNDARFAYARRQIMVNQTLKCVAILLVGITIGAPTPATAQSDPDAISRPTADWPAASPDGTRLAFVSNATGTETIWIANRDGSNAKPLLNWRGSAQIDP